MVGQLFRRFARWTADLMGSSGTFLVALALIAAWAVTGPIFRFSDTWQLIINTATTIVTFLMVFLIQNTQNRDAMVMHLKLDELLRAVEAARNGLVSLEEQSDESLARLKGEFSEISQQNGTASPAHGWQPVEAISNKSEPLP
jgi:low affinity Fe/Cu permease